MGFFAKHLIESEGFVRVYIFDLEGVSDKTILPFSLSYDHRVINAVDAGNFMNFIKSVIEKGL